MFYLFQMELQFKRTGIGMSKTHFIKENINLTLDTTTSVFINNTRTNVFFIVEHNQVQNFNSHLTGVMVIILHLFLRQMSH